MYCFNTLLTVHEAFHWDSQISQGNKILSFIFISLKSQTHHGSKVNLKVQLCVLTVNYDVCYGVFGWRQETHFTISQWWFKWHEFSQIKCKFRRKANMEDDQCQENIRKRNKCPCWGGGVSGVYMASVCNIWLVVLPNLCIVTLKQPLKVVKNSLNDLPLQAKFKRMLISLVSSPSTNCDSNGCRCDAQLELVFPAKVSFIWQQVYPIKIIRIY